MKIATLIPTRGLIFTQAVTAVLRELAANNQPALILTTDDIPLPESRNALVEDALETDATHFLLIDDDVIIPEEGLKSMIDLDVDIAFIDYPMHYDVGKWKNMGTMCPDNWLLGTEWRDKPVKWGGLGCVLVKRKVFETMGKPWFMAMHKAFKREKGTGKIIFVGTMETGEMGGEDSFFFMNANKAGFKIKMVRDQTAGHARLEKLIMHLQSGKYTSQHKIKINNHIDQPYSAGGTI